MSRIASTTYRYCRCTSHHRWISTSDVKHATTLPLTATGPPPSAPSPAASMREVQQDRRLRQAEIIKRNQERKQDVRTSGGIKRRFWKDVLVRSNEDASLSIYLDSKPLKNPHTRERLRIPASRPQLATAIALEWDLLTSAQQATRSHLIPLTQLACRAEALAIEDDRAMGQEGFAELGSKGEGIRYDIVNLLLRYLDTDTLLCWAPATSPTAEAMGQEEKGSKLRQLQISTALPIMAYLSEHAWPGAELQPALDDGSILPKSQPAHTRAIIKSWLARQSAWDLVGIERAALASKSVCVASRLVCEWKGRRPARAHFGITEAAHACSLEVIWQTGQWGEVEDSHDVDKEDLRRQLGGVVLLVSHISV